MAGLADFPVHAVLRADDLERAAKFYTKVLGLRRQDMGGPTGEAIFRGAGESGVMVYERPGMAAPQNTTLGFAVPADAFDGVVATLRARGVILEEYDLPEIGLKTESGVATFGETRAVWFKDTEGNILNIATT